MRTFLVILSVLALLASATAQVGGAGFGISVHDPGNFIASDSINPMDQFHVSFWFRQEACGFSLYMDEGEQPLAAAYWVGETHLTFEVNNRRVETLTPFSPHEWTHMAFNWKASDGQAEIYINAQLAASGTLAAPALPQSRLYFSRPYTEGWNTRMYGELDEVALLNTTLDATQIQSLMNQRPSSTTIPMERIVLYWGFESVDVAAKTILPSFGSDIVGRVLRSSFDLYKGLFNVQDISLMPSSAPFIGSGYSVVNTIANRDTIVPLAGVAGKTPTIDSIPTSGSLYLLDASGAVTATTATPGASAPFGVAYRGTPPDSFLYTIEGEQAEGIINANKAPAAKDITIDVIQGYLGYIALGVQSYNPFGSVVYADMFQLDEDDHQSSVTLTILNIPAGGLLNATDFLAPFPITSAPFNVSAGSFILYTAPFDTFGTNFTTMSYIAYDGQSYSDVKTYTFNILQSINPPAPTGRIVQTEENAPLTIDLSDTIPVIAERDTIPPGGGMTVDPLYVQVVNLPAKGTLYQTDGNSSTRLIQDSAPSITLESVWVSRVVNASSWRASGGFFWAPEQVIGEPNAFPVYGDSMFAWSPANPNGYEWITVGFPKKLYASGLEIYVNWYPGTINRIAAYHYGLEKFVTVYDTLPVAKSTSTSATIYTPALCPMTFASDIFRIEYSPAGPGSYVEIDAIRLTGSASPLRVDIVNIESPKLQYSPNPYANGPDSFSFILNRCTYWSYYRDGSLATANVSVLVSEINYPPHSNSSEFVLDAVADAQTSYSIIFPVEDPDGLSGVHGIIVSLPAFGILSATEGGPALQSGDSLPGTEVFYTPRTCSNMGELNFADSFQFQLSDGELATEFLTATLLVDCEGPIQKMLKPAVNFVIAFCVLCAVLILISIGLVVAWKDTQTIRSISPMFCIIALVGALSVVLSPIFITPYIESCMAWLAMLAYGVIFFFSSIIVKAFRLDRIFNNKSLRVFSIPNKQLFMYLGVLLIPETVLLIVWGVQSPFGIKRIPIPNSRQSIAICSSDNATIYTIIQMAYLVLLFLVAAVLGWRIRNIPLGQYKESKEIFFSVYNCGFVALVATPLAMIQFWNSTATLIIICVGSCFAATVSIIILFASKFSRIVRDKEVSAKWSQTSRNTPSKSGSVLTNDDLRTTSPYQSSGLASRVIGRKRTTDTMTGTVIEDQPKTVLEGLASNVLAGNSSSTTSSSSDHDDSDGSSVVEMEPVKNPPKVEKKKQLMKKSKKSKKIVEDDSDESR